MSGKQIRLSRLFKPETGKAVIIPVDHGLVMGSIKGLSDPVGVLEKLIELGIDATLMSPGLAKVTAELFKSRNAPARILTADSPLISSVPGNFDGVLAHKPVATVEYALRWGFDVVKVLFPWGSDKEVQSETIELTANFANECDRWGMPLMVEPVLWGSAIPKEQQNDPKLIENAARVALEVGADIIKMPYTGDKPGFSELVKDLRVPIVVLGGPKMERTSDILRVAEESVEAGAKGIVFGRNVWQYPAMGDLLAALKDVVHENADIDTVMSRYRLE